MIPILYPADEMMFESNGIGRLSDSISCIVTEERNGVYELEMIYPVQGQHFESIQLGCLILATPNGKADQAQPFEIVNIIKTTDQEVDIFAVHVSYRLSYIPVKPVSNTAYISASAAIAAVLDKVAGSHPFTIKTDKANKAAFHADTPASLKSILFGTEGSILDMYGGTWDFDYFTATLKGQRGEDTDIVIRWGKDLTGLKYEESRENIFTGVLPYWKGNVSSNNQTQEVVVVADSPVNVPAYAKKLPYARNIALDVSTYFESGEYETQPSKNQVRDKGKAYVNANVTGTENVTITVNFAPLWQRQSSEDMRRFERIGLCDEVTVVHGPMEIIYSGKVVKTVYDVLMGRYKSLELGFLKPKLSDLIGGNE